MAERTTRHRTVAVDVDAESRPARRPLAWPWYLVAVLGPAVVVVAGWLLMAGAAALGWLTTPEADLGAALSLATDMLLLAHGGHVDIAGQRVSLVPLTLTLALLVLAMPVAAFAARQAANAEAEADDTGELWVDGRPLVTRVAGTFAAAYAATVALFCTAAGGPAWLAVLGGLAVGGVAGIWGACRAISYDPFDGLPHWARAVPRAMGWAVVTCLAGGAVVLVTALVQHWDKVAEIQRGLEPGPAGTILLVLLQLLFLPNLIGWTTAWVLGAGITLGDGSVVTQSVTDVGFLPAIPVLGAIPAPGAGSTSLHWWLLVGVAAGAVAAFVVVRARPRARFDETALVGGLSGVLAGLLVTVACSLASGGLGWERLSFIGAEVGDLFIVAPSLLGLSGLLTGLGMGLLQGALAARRGTNRVPTDDLGDGEDQA